MHRCPAAAATCRTPLTDRRLPHGARRFPRYAPVGTATTLAYLVLYRLLQPGFGTPIANLAALLSTTVLNTLVNARYTFAPDDQAPIGWLRPQLLGLLALCMTLAFTQVALTAAAASAAGPVAETIALVAACALAATARYALLRLWLFPPARTSQPDLQVARPDVRLTTAVG